MSQVFELIDVYASLRPPYVVAEEVLETCWDMLSTCNALIIAPDSGASGPLEVMAERIGFGDVASSLAPRPLAHGPTFFIVHYEISEPAMGRVISELRSAADDDTRYAPIILITDDCPVDRLLRYIKLGFDDVIALPEKREVLESRIAAQLHTDQIYFETGDYLGPDRRRMELTPQRDERRNGSIPYHKLTIRRDPAIGISVLRRQMFGQQQRQGQDASMHLAPRSGTPGAAAGRFLV
jgi:hypothetical protein